MSSINARRAANFCLLIITAVIGIGCNRTDDPRLANPKSTARTLFQAMYDNDVITAKDCILVGPGQAEIVEGMTKMMAAMRGATDAAYKRYGDEFTKLAGGSLDMTRIDSQQIDAGIETLTDETAAIVLPNGKMTLRLVRTGRLWKVDMVQSFAPGAKLDDPQLMRVMISMFTGMARAADQTKADIESGKFQSARPAVQALLTNMKKAVEEEQERAIREFTSG